jgi:hypothetical protein
MGYFYADAAHDFALPRHRTMTLSLAAGYFLNGGLAHPNNGPEALALFVAVPLKASR